MNQNLLKNLESYLQQASVDILRSISYKQLKKILKAEDSEINQFVIDLHEEHLIDFKYNCYCPKCNEMITIYEEELKKHRTRLCECGMDIDLNEVVKKSRLLFSINKNEILSYYKLESLDLRDETLHIIDLQTRKVVGNEKNNITLVTNKKEVEKMKIFIGSSTEAKPIMKKIAYYIEEAKHIALRWDDNTLFPAGSFTMESIVKISKDADAAIFVFSGDDLTWYRGKPNTTVRDNVLIEYGIFVGARGIRNSVFVCTKDPKIPTDLLGITRIDAENGDTHLEHQIEVWLKSIE